MANDSPILAVQDLNVVVRKTKPKNFIVKDVSFSLKRKEILAIVGGSGSGKSTTAFAIMNLLASALRVSKGKIIYDNKELLVFTQELMQEIRGKEIGMVFQEPLYAFNPLFTVGHQIGEVLQTHTQLNRVQRKEKVMDLLATVGLKDPDRVYKSYPHQLSGGMRQRAMIAQAISVDPKVIIADEPTSNLDVTLQAKIMKLFDDLRNKLDLSILLISHDLGMVGHLADNVVVMQKGAVVEKGKVTEVTKNPKHEYTRRLMGALEVKDDG